MSKPANEMKEIIDKIISNLTDALTAATEVKAGLDKDELLLVPFTTLSAGSAQADRLVTKFAVAKEKATQDILDS